MIGKRIRIERILNRKTGRCVIVPMDHGVSIGPVPGITDMAAAIDEVASGGANAVIEHKGMVGKGHRGYGNDIGLIIHLSIRRQRQMCIRDRNYDTSTCFSI